MSDPAIGKKNGRAPRDQKNSVRRLLALSPKRLIININKIILSFSQFLPFSSVFFSFFNPYKSLVCMQLHFSGLCVLLTLLKANTAL